MLIKCRTSGVTKGFDADELKAQYSSLKEQKQDYQSKLAILEAQSLTKFTVDETAAKIALRQIKTDIESNQPLEEYKKLFATFLDSVNVFDDEVTINFNILSMIGSNAKATGLPQNNKPPLETNQMVVWNGGDEPRLRQYVNGNPLHYTIPREELFKYTQNIELVQLLLPHLDINALVGRHRNEQI